MAETWPIGTRDMMRSGTIIEVADELIEGSCKGCLFDDNTGECNVPMYLCECLAAFRDDHIGIIFKKVEQKKDKTMERPIGSEFEYKGHRLMVVEHLSCDGCILNKYKDRHACWMAGLGLCSGDFRSDHRSVIFKEIGTVTNL